MRLFAGERTIVNINSQSRVVDGKFFFAASAAALGEARQVCVVLSIQFYSLPVHVSRWFRKTFDEATRKAEMEREQIKSNGTGIFRLLSSSQPKMS